MARAWIDTPHVNTSSCFRSGIVRRQERPQRSLTCRASEQRGRVSQYSEHRFHALRAGRRRLRPPAQHPRRRGCRRHGGLFGGAEEDGPGGLGLQHARPPEEGSELLLLELRAHLLPDLLGRQLLGVHAVDTHQAVPIPHPQLGRLLPVPHVHDGVLGDLVDHEAVRLLEDVLVPLHAPLVVRPPRQPHAHPHALGASALLIAGLRGLRPLATARTTPSLRGQGCFQGGDGFAKRRRGAWQAALWRLAAEAEHAPGTVLLR
mmetsp:Transcript_124289/g.362896  ORF Transcript_124289/g.362896 Transcript_124289/m.362896 type:complete len:261 (+) Transcript_124289:789-1571(+)